MRYAICADVHIGNHHKFGGPVERGINTRCGEAIAALEFMYEAAANAGCDCVIVAGDLYDTARPLPQMIRMVDDIIRGNQLETLLLVGNHECVSNEPGDHALVVHSSATVIDCKTLKATDTSRLYLFPWQCDGLTIKNTRCHDTEINSSSSGAIIAHCGIYDDGSPAWMRNSKNAISVNEAVDACHRLGCSHFFAGHWHTKRVWRREDVIIIQLGALCPTGFGDLPPHGQFVVWDSRADALEWHDATGPRFVLMDVGDDIPLAGTSITYVGMRCTDEQRVMALEKLNAAKKRGDIDGFQIVLQREVDEALQRAAMSIQSGETTAKAIDEYVAMANLPPDVNREDVASKVKGLLGL